MPGCLNRLMDTYLARSAGIVEAEQWPSPHPKEFDSATLETPWASGAFSLIAADMFDRLGGFDPTYFLYLEDVDLSWRAWLGGWPVLYQPQAKAYHATGMYSYQKDRLYFEHYFSLRNFLAIAYKFWGDLGERVAMEYLKQAKVPEPFLQKAVADYRRLRPAIAIQPGVGVNAEKVKILGLNTFHEFR
jgi:GT2 family glycosyltransferase